MLPCRKKSDMDDTKPINKQGEAASLSDASSSSTKATSSPGRARRVSMKFKKGFREVKEMLSPHHHHHHQHQQQQQQQQQHEHTGSPDRHSDHRRRLLRRKSGPNESRRGPLAPVLDHLEKSNSVPIHLHISHTGDFSISRKGSSSSYSCSDVAHDDESKSLTDVHHHLQAKEEQSQPQPPQPPPQIQTHTQTQTQTIEPEAEPPQPQPQPPQLEPEPQPPMAVSEPPQHSDDDGERTPNPFLVDDPEDPLSDPGSPTPAPVPPLPLDPVTVTTTLPLEVPPPAVPVALTPAHTELPLPPDTIVDPTSASVPAPPPPVDKPVPALPVSSETESETGDEPAVHLPQLVMPTMFLPIPNVRLSSHLTWWLTRRTPIYY